MDPKRRSEIRKSATRLLLTAGIRSCPFPLINLYPYLASQVERHEFDFSDESSWRRFERRYLKIGEDLKFAVQEELLSAIAKLRESAVAFFYPRGRVVAIDARLVDTTKRWSDAHELGHVFLKHEGAEVYDLAASDLSFNMNTAEDEEANEFASSLLFPSWEAAAWRPDKDSFEDAVRMAAYRFQVSPQVAAIEIVRRLDHPCFLLVIPRRRHGKNGKIENKPAWSEARFVLSPHFGSQPADFCDGLLAQILKLWPQINSMDQQGVELKLHAFNRVRFQSYYTMAVVLLLGEIDWQSSASFF
jgi:hypothetical protein